MSKPPPPPPMRLSDEDIEIIGSSGPPPIRPSTNLGVIFGIQEAETVVAINSDPEAPIFEAADYCIVDDLFQVLPSLIEALQHQQGNGDS